MIFLKKALLLIICIITVFVTASCQSAPPMTAKEELILHQWGITDSVGKEQGVISFENGKMNVNANLSDKNFKFSEDCMIDDKNIIVNSKDYGVITVSYEMSGETLNLEYFGKKITLKKK